MRYIKTDNVLQYDIMKKVLQYELRDLRITRSQPVVTFFYMFASARACRSNSVVSVKSPASFAIERSAKASAEARMKCRGNRRKSGESGRETSRARGRKEWSRSRQDIRLRGQGLCLRVISCKNPINFLNPPPVAKGVANKRAYEDEGGTVTR